MLRLFADQPRLIARVGVDVGRDLRLVLRLALLERADQLVLRLAAVLRVRVFLVLLLPADKDKMGRVAVLSVDVRRRLLHRQLLVLAADEDRLIAALVVRVRLLPAEGLLRHGQGGACQGISGRGGDSAAEPCDPYAPFAPPCSAASGHTAACSAGGCARARSAPWAADPRPLCVFSSVRHPFEHLLQLRVCLDQLPGLQLESFPMLGSLTLRGIHDLFCLPLGVRKDLLLLLLQRIDDIDQICAAQPPQFLVRHGIAPSFFVRPSARRAGERGGNAIKMSRTAAAVRAILSSA